MKKKDCDMRKEKKEGGRERQKGETGGGNHRGKMERQKGEKVSGKGVGRRGG